MTFSVVAYDPEEKKWGVGVASRFLSVGSIVPWAKAGVGCIATQSYANYSYGPEGLKLLETGDSRKTIETLTGRDDLKDRRQVAAVDSHGRPFAFTGSGCHDFAGHILGDHFSVQGNILAGSKVLESMANAMNGEGKLEWRILSALKAAEKAGGDKRGKQSASILIVSEVETFEEGSDIYMNIRIEDSVEPLEELARIMELWTAMFLDKETVLIADHETEINKALSAKGFSDLDSWGRANNMEHNIRDGRIGKYTLKILVSHR
ncbi:MAG: DUF1028 domain-containing protein [Candidatus Thermoplasmatota archaeon]|nr:DUF1028 domain-containing protein [Candidatus Thermoplasmatota archaeon]